MPWANLNRWFQGESLKILILTKLNSLFDLYAKPIDNPDHFKSFTNLETLVLSQNRISQIADGAFRFQSKLKTLNLRKNWLRKINPGTFQGLDQLTTLDLSYNFLVVVAIEDFGNAWHTEPLLTVNLGRNQFECGCNMTELAQDFNNTGYQLIVENFQCAGPTPLRNKYITDIETIQSNLTSECEPPVLSSCCPDDDTIVADPSQDNRVEIKCKATGVPAPKVWCEPISGNPMPKDLTPWYFEEETYNSFVSRWCHAEVEQSGTVRCWAMNPSGVVSKDCTVHINSTYAWSVDAGMAVTPGGMSVFAALSLTAWLFERTNT
ncbi:leucine-rich repeat and fibronectin type-III domain-containing protein 4-like [Lineus longissimus]|uniref:leucine-rich repeat and fibronectin type-III domain-containing protein 4-like n=1 Tax=Lineus longissimus TaxID=88925 RepID=UPI00315D4CC4